MLEVQEKLNEWGKSKTPFAFLIDFECKKPRCWRLDEPVDEFKFKFQNFTNFQNFANSDHIIKKDFTFHKMPISFEDYKLKFEIVKNEIQYGNSFLVNLTAETKIETNLTFAEIAKFAKAKYICWLKDEFICFSPETFVQIKNRTIYSFPMKGTVDARIQNAEYVILSDPKEIAEHATIVDLIRNDISMVADKVKVRKYRFYEEIHTGNGLLGQVSSVIEGLLPENYHEKIGDIIFNLLPAGSISGAPKARTKEIIMKAEQSDRGYYTGIAGYFDGSNLDSCVLIRYLQSDFIFRSGGGITAKSECSSEYSEMINKVYVPIF